MGDWGSDWESDRGRGSNPIERALDWLDLSRTDVDDRLRALLDAIRVAEAHAPKAVLEATGEELGEILRGIIPGLLLCLCVVAATTGVGAAGGAAVGALAGGIGAVPGAMLGAGLGLEAGVALLEILGLAFLAALIGKSLGEATGMAAGAVNEAWHASDEPTSRWFHVEHAGRTLAEALGVLVQGILQGLVAFLLARGSAAAAARVPELVARLRGSRLGKGFAEWVERSWARLLANEKLRPRSERSAQTGAAPGGAGAPRATDPTPERPAAARAPGASASSERTLPTGQRGGMPTGRRQPVLSQDDAATRRSHQRENDSADLLAREGYRVEQRPPVPGGSKKKPDYRIEGRIFDCKAPSTPRARNAASEIQDAIVDGQADRFILNLEDTPLSPADMKAQLASYPIEGLKEVIAIKGGRIIPLWP